jgi:hypothetical protein
MGVRREGASERSMRYLAMQIAIQLPESRIDALRVLALAGELTTHWLPADEPGTVLRFARYSSRRRRSARSTP